MPRMLRKGQVTSFIIIGIIVLAITGTVFYIFHYAHDDGEMIPPSMRNIKDFTDQCLRQTAERAIFLSGVQGGMIYFGDVVPNQPTFYSYSTYWYDMGDNKSISKEFIEREINAYIEDEVGRCIKDYRQFKERIITSELSAETEIKDESVEVTMDYPVTLVRGDMRSTISAFSAEIPVRYGRAINTANEIVSMEIENPDRVRLSETGRMELKVVPYKRSDDVMIYSIIDSRNEVNGLDFKLIFSSRFGNESSGNRAPEIINANNLLMVEGAEAEYTFAASDMDDDQLEFSSIGRFSVSEDGVLRITPSEEDVGDHSLTIIVRDGKGGRDAETVKVKVMGA